MTDVKLGADTVAMDDSVCRKTDAGTTDILTAIEVDPLRGVVVTLQTLGKMTYRVFAKNWDKVGA